MAEFKKSELIHNFIENRIYFLSLFKKKQLVVYQQLKIINVTYLIKSMKKMKKRIAILSLIAIFVSATALTAQTTTTAKTEKAKTEVKCEKKGDAKCAKAEMKGCCKDKKSTACCKKGEAKACCKDKKAEVKSASEKK